MSADRELPSWLNLWIFCFPAFGNKIFPTLFGDALPPQHWYGSDQELAR